MQKYRRISGWYYRHGIAQQHLIIAGIPALPSERMDFFNQALRLGYLDMIEMYGINKPKTPDELGIKTRVQFRNETKPVAVSRRGSIIYRKRLVPFVMEVRAKIPSASYASEKPLGYEWPDASMTGVYFYELEGIIDAALSKM